MQSTYQLSTIHLARSVCANLSKAHIANPEVIKEIGIVITKKRAIGEAINLICKQCGINFKGHRKNRKFCSPNCRTSSHADGEKKTRWEYR